MSSKAVACFLQILALLEQEDKNPEKDILYRGLLDLARMIEDLHNIMEKTVLPKLEKIEKALETLKTVS